MITNEKRKELREKRLQRKKEKNTPQTKSKSKFNIPSFVDKITESFYKNI